MMQWVLIAVLLGSGQAVPPGAAAATDDLPPSVVLVTIDTLRADRFRDGAVMPNLQRLASRGVTFTNVRALTPLTLPSHTSILTGVGTAAHGVRDNIGYPVPQDLPFLAGRFRQAGFETGAFIGGYPLQAEFGLDEGFDTYDDRLDAAPLGSAAGHTERRAGDVVSAALVWAGDRGGAKWFLWVHLYDPHEPYEAPASFWRPSLEPYDREVAYADAALGRLLEGLGERTGGRLIALITSDHGEMLGEHGEATHGVFLYDGALRVPLVLIRPGGAAGTVDPRPASLLDVAPTLAEAAGLPRVEGLEGHSLLGPAKGTVLYLESVHGRRRYGWAPLYGYLDWPLKYLFAPVPELYDLENDPGERRNLLLDRSDHRYRTVTRRLRSAMRQPDDAGEIAGDVAKLQALGYVGGGLKGAGQDILDDRERPDPKSRIAALAPLEEGLRLLRQGRPEPAGRQLRAAAGIDPDNLVALNNLGILAVQAGEYEEAAGWFRKGLRRDNHADNIASNLGMALSKLGRHREAVNAYRTALDANPEFHAARFNLAVALARGGDKRAARKELERLLREDPAFPGLDDLKAVLLQDSPANH